MEPLRQIGAGFLLAIISLSLVLGGFALSVAEGGKSSLRPSGVPTLLVIETNLDTTMIVPTQLISGTSDATATELGTITATITPPPPPASCLPPSGWVVITVQFSDTLNSLAQTYQTSAAAIMGGNCLFSDQLVVGSFLYVPSLATATSLPCGAPAGWINYRVIAGDTLYSIGLRYGVSVATIQKANCLYGSSYIHIGQLLKVPNVVPVPLSTWTAIPTKIIPPSDTPINTPVTPGYP